MRTLKLYTTSACHLCEIAEAAISPELEVLQLKLERVEISDSDELMALYGVRIPVLGLEGRDNGGSAELNWPFDREQFLDFVREN